LLLERACMITYLCIASVMYSCLFQGTYLCEGESVHYVMRWLRRNTEDHLLLKLILRLHLTLLVTEVEDIRINTQNQRNMMTLNIVFCKHTSELL
jgi:hypothetical protein